jgi:hypothetical protein
MMGLAIEIADGRTSFRGGEAIAGEVSWSLPRAADEIVLELLWTTRGKGTVDSQVVQSARFQKPPAQDSQPFEFALPNAPLSFNGKLVSVVWYLRLLAKPSNEQTQLKIAVSPTGHEIELSGG